jgi:hypothetical protein
VSLLLGFVAGVVAAYTYRRTVGFLARTQLGRRAGIGKDARRNFLAGLDYDALVSFRDDVARELGRRQP